MTLKKAGRHEAKGYRRRRKGAVHKEKSKDGVPAAIKKVGPRGPRAGKRFVFRQGACLGEVMQGVTGKKRTRKNSAGRAAEREAGTCRVVQGQGRMEGTGRKNCVMTHSSN